MKLWKSRLKWQFLTFETILNVFFPKKTEFDCWNDTVNYFSLKILNLTTLTLLLVIYILLNWKFVMIMIHFRIPDICDSDLYCGIHVFGGFKQFSWYCLPTKFWELNILAVTQSIFLKITGVHFTGITSWQRMSQVD